MQLHWATEPENEADTSRIVVYRNRQHSPWSHGVENARFRVSSGP